MHISDDEAGKIMTVVGVLAAIGLAIVGFFVWAIGSIFGLFGKKE